MRIEKFLDVVVCLTLAVAVIIGINVPVCRDAEKSTSAEPIKVTASTVKEEAEQATAASDEDVLAYLNNNVNPGGEWKMDTGSCLIFYPSGSFAEGLAVLHEYPDGAELRQEYGEILDAFCEVNKTVDKVAGKKYNLELADTVGEENALAEISGGKVDYDYFGTR